MAVEILYTETELMKIYISGAILAVAIVVLAWYGGKYIDARYRERARKKEQEQRIANGEPQQYIAEPIPVESCINKKLFAVLGIAIIAIGAVQLFL
ncbi:MAG: hypothetical protein PHV83_05360 [Bacteroidales bacterium]|nr:hypothetical protein [Bacteroidales bacterium]